MGLYSIWDLFLQWGCTRYVLLDLQINSPTSQLLSVSPEVDQYGHLSQLPFPLASSWVYSVSLSRKSEGWRRVSSWLYARSGTSEEKWLKMYINTSHGLEVVNFIIILWWWPLGFQLAYLSKYFFLINSKIIPTSLPAPPTEETRMLTSFNYLQIPNNTFHVVYPIFP